MSLLSTVQFTNNEPSLNMQLNHNIKTPLGQLSTQVTTGSQKNFTPQRKDFSEQMLAINKQKALLKSSASV